MKLSEDDFDSVVDTNLKGSFHCMRFAARQMIRQRSGRIINLSSVSGVMGNAGQTNYSASKSRRDWADKSGSAGASGKKYYSECNCTWIYCNRYDRKTFRSRKRNGGDTDSDGAFRDSGRYCTCGSISCYRRSGIYYRAGTLCGRRNGNVENEGERHEKRVVVTGLGAVTPIGNNVETFWNGIKEGKVGIGPITKFDTAEYKVKIAAEVKGFSAKEHMDFKAAKRMELFSQYAVAAAKEACADAGLEMEKEDPYRVGVIVGSGIGSLATVEKEYEKILGKRAGKSQSAHGAIDDLQYGSRKRVDSHWS